MLALALAVSSLFAAAPPTANPAAALPYDDARFELVLGGRAGGRFLPTHTPTARPTSFGGGINLGLGVRLWQGLFLEAGIAEGVYQNPQRDVASFRHIGLHPDTGAAAAVVVDPSNGSRGILAGQILLGVRYEIRTVKTMRLRPSVFLGATHVHEATLRDFGREPGKTLAGVSRSIRHRTGAQVGVGLRVPFPERWGKVAPRFSARFDVDASYYFDAQPGRIQAGLGLGVQVLF